MGFADLWSRTLVYFGIAEEDDYWDEDGYATNEELERTYNDRPNVRRLPRAGARRLRRLDRLRHGRRPGRGGRAGAARSAREPAAPPGRAASRPRRARTSRCTSSSRAASTTPSRSPTGSRTASRSSSTSRATDQELSKRLIDFASGLTYALNGGMQRVADKVFLLTPRNVEVSAEERARLLERGGFFNQA